LSVLKPDEPHRQPNIVDAAAGEAPEVTVKSDPDTAVAVPVVPVGVAWYPVANSTTEISAVYPVPPAKFAVTVPVPGAPVTFAHAIAESLYAAPTTSWISAAIVHDPTLDREVVMELTLLSAPAV